MSGLPVRSVTGVKGRTGLRAPRFGKTATRSVRRFAETLFCATLRSPGDPPGAPRPSPSLHGLSRWSFGRAWFDTALARLLTMTGSEFVILSSPRSGRVEGRKEDRMTRRNPPSKRRRNTAQPGSLEAQLAAIEAEAAEMKMKLMVEVARRRLRLLKLPPANPPKRRRV